MTHYFLDSSALIKRYIPELGTSWVQSLALTAAGNTLVIAPITQIEIMSGVARRKRENLLSVGSAQAIRVLLDQHVWQEYVRIELSASLIQWAEDLIDKYPLRAFDSVQLASALVANTQLVTTNKPPLLFISGDKRLLAAASAEGLTVDDPNAHP